EVDDILAASTSLRLEVVDDGKDVRWQSLDPIELVHTGLLLTSPPMIRACTGGVKKGAISCGVRDQARAGTDVDCRPRCRYGRGVSSKPLIVRAGLPARRLPPQALRGCPGIMRGQFGWAGVGTPQAPGARRPCATAPA